MKDQNVQESPDVQVGETIDGIEHPDPRMRPARLSVAIPALFWRRLRRHIESCQSSSVERELWEQWLSPRAVAQLLSNETPNERMNESMNEALGVKMASPRLMAAGSEPIVPESALRHLRDTILESLQRPLALRLHPEPAGRPGSPFTDPTYLLVLTNGASLVMRITNTNKPSNRELIPARLDDCFFTRAAADFARPPGDFALPGSPMSAGRRSNSGFHAPLRDAVVREWVGRLALATGNEHWKGLVPPDRPCDVGVGSAPRTGLPTRKEATPRREPAETTQTRAQDRITSSDAGVQFLRPTEWGFNGGPNGCVWVGSVAETSAPNSISLRRILGGGGGHRPESNSHANRRPGKKLSQPRFTRYPLTVSTVAGTSHATPFSSSASSQTGQFDALACTPELTRVMEEYPWALVQAGEVCRAAPADSSLDAAAYQSAVALGRCRLIGSAPDDLSELTLSPACGVSAARELALRLKQWAGRAKSLPADMRGATALRASDRCMGVFEARLEAWAAYIAIDESYSAAIDAGDASVEMFSQAIDAVLDELASFDDAIQWAQPLLASVVAGPNSRLLDNWKSLLASPYRQSPPWWLDCMPLGQAI